MMDMKEKESFLIRTAAGVLSLLAIGDLRWQIQEER
jgi:hypothetical protein